MAGKTIDRDRAMNAASNHNAVETEYINQWADYGPMDIKVSNARRIALGAHGGPDLADVVHVCRTGSVENVDMLEERGLWTVVGENVDGDLLELEIAVESEELRIELLAVTVLNRSG